jgi:hypothetical protein
MYVSVINIFVERFQFWFLTNEVFPADFEGAYSIGFPVSISEC